MGSFNALTLIIMHLIYLVIFHRNVVQIPQLVEVEKKSGDRQSQ